MKKLLSQTGQGVFGVVLATSLVTGVANWIVNRTLNSPTNMAAAIAAVKTDVAVLQKSDTTHDEAIKKLQDNIEYIRRMVEAIGRNQGISIDDKKP